jgi:hypothetical protein
VGVRRGGRPACILFKSSQRLSSRALLPPPLLSQNLPQRIRLPAIKRRRMQIPPHQRQRTLLADHRRPFALQNLMHQLPVAQPPAPYSRVSGKRHHPVIPILVLLICILRCRHLLHNSLYRTPNTPASALYHPSSLQLLCQKTVPPVNTVPNPTRVCARSQVWWPPRDCHTTSASQVCDASPRSCQASASALYTAREPFLVSIQRSPAANPPNS